MRAVVLAWLALPLLSAGVQEVSAGAAGPYSVVGKRIVDGKGRAFVMRGTQLAAFRMGDVAANNRAGKVFGAHSATTLSAIRLRFNMNTVRLPVAASEAGMPGYWRELGKVVDRANALDLVVVLAAEGDGAFWGRVGKEFGGRPNVMFAVGDAANAVALREAGATQLVAVRTGEAGGNIIREVTAKWGELFQRPEGAVMVNGLDLALGDAAACPSVPSDPGAAWRMVDQRLSEFAEQEVSWTISEFVAGKLVSDLADYSATTLEDGWTCGEPPLSNVGMGRAVVGFLRASQERALFVVSGNCGVTVGRGAFAIAYGPVMAVKDTQGPAGRPPERLGGIRVRVTDSAGVSRWAGILWASAGWGQTNFVVPEESAEGPSVMEIVRDDGSRARANLTIAATAPGLQTTLQSCQGPAILTAVGSGLRLTASGLRHAKEITVAIDGVLVPVLRFGAIDLQGRDFLTVAIPASLRGRGEVDLICRADGRTSNSARVRIE